MSHTSSTTTTASGSSFLRFDGRVAVITGSGGGLGKAYALLLASRGAKVVINDLGGSTTGNGADKRAADIVVEEIRAAGGHAVADYNSVENGEKIIDTAVRNFGRIDILICNAGILRDRSFAKMDDAAWDAVVNVHLRGSWKCALAAWPLMRDQGYGRIVFITSASGIYGNFGQSNYAAAKMGLVGLSNTLAREGSKRGILSNAVAPIAASRMTEGIMPPDLLRALHPDAVAPLVGYLCHEKCTTNGALYELGGGWMSRLRWQRSRGAFLDVSGGTPPTPEQVADCWNEVEDFDNGGATYPDSTQAAFGPMMENLQRAQDAAAAKGAGAGAKGSGSSSTTTMQLQQLQLAPLPGGNFGKSDSVDVAAAIQHTFPPVKCSYTERDTCLYAISIGAGSVKATDPFDLKYTYELTDGGLQVFPTFAVLWPHTTMAEVTTSMSSSLRFNPMMLLHGEQEVVFNGALPASASIVTQGRVTNVYDKGSGALLIIECTTRELVVVSKNGGGGGVEEEGRILAINRSSIFLRGVGGFGGDRGPAPDPWKPLNPSTPQYTELVPTSTNAALLYRLNGDYNPLHADPEFAGMGGFKAPILHGLCTFGIAGRVLVRRYGNTGDDGNSSPLILRSIKSRFVKHVFPGETILVECFEVDASSSTRGSTHDTNTTTILFQCRVKERNGELVLSHGVAVFGGSDTTSSGTFAKL